EVMVGMAVLSAFESKPEMLKALSEINLRDLENPRVILRGGVVVDLGSGHFRGKVDQLSQVLEELKRLGEKPKAIDLRFARQVVVRRIEPAGTTKKEV
ncbi:MAG TPA: cell division protein FtsQ/DivIB, partial [bacterium]|nr:cell division protein FtsQ/DivIB [bacterium]